MRHNSSDAVPDEYFDFKDTSQYEDYDLSTDDSDRSNASVAPAVEPQSMNSDLSSVVTLSDAVMSNDEASSVTEAPAAAVATRKKRQLPYWAFPTLPTITETENLDQKIVGGNEVTPGEIPWQVGVGYRVRRWERGRCCFWNVVPGVISAKEGA